MKKALYRDTAVKLRVKGYSINEIASKLPISKSTASDWLRDIDVSPKGRLRLTQRVSLAQRQSAENNRNRKLDRIESFYQTNLGLISKERISTNQAKILCAMIYWCEGVKDDGRIKFVNSDPKLMRTFLSLFRYVYRVDESKFRALVHIHDYHDEQKQKKFWSEITNIPVSQFNNSWRKANTGIRLREGYQGCLAVNYYDALVAQDLLSCAQAFMTDK